MQVESEAPAVTTWVRMERGIKAVLLVKDKAEEKRDHDHWPPLEFS